MKWELHLALLASSIFKLTRIVRRNDYTRPKVSDLLFPSIERQWFNESLFLLAFVGNYKCQLHDPKTGGFMQSSPGIGMHVEIRDPEDKTILSKVYSSEGRFSFTSYSPGEHVICLYSNSSSWFSGSQLVSCAGPVITKL